MKRVVKKLLEFLPRESAIRLGTHLLTKYDPQFVAVRDLLLEGGHGNHQWNSGLGVQAYLLYGLVRTHKPTHILEIGSATGLSSCTMALACRHNKIGKVFAVDPHDVNDWNNISKSCDGQLDFFKSRIAEYALSDYCTIIQSTSEQAAKKWSLPIDLMFIDGDHSYEGVRKDFELFKKWLTPPSLVLFHNSGWEFNRDHQSYRQGMGVPKYLSELKAAGFQSVTVLDEVGLTILDPKKGGLDFLNRH